MRRIIAGFLLAAVVGYAVVGFVHAQSSPLSYPGSDLTCTNAVSGDGWNVLAAKVGAPSGLALAQQEGGTLSTTVRVGQRVCWAPSPAVAPTTTTTVPSTSTTLPPTTTVTTTTSTTSTTTVAPTPSTTTVPTTTQPPAGVQFLETFTAGAGLDRFDFGVYHRDGTLVATRQWQADHDMACGDPTATSRAVHRDTDEWIFTCRDHLMTSIGDTSGYSTGWFAPKQTFTGARSVSWDVNVTDLGNRQWWEVSIVPVSFASGVSSCPHCSANNTVAATAGLPDYPTGAVVVGNGPLGFNPRFTTNGQTVNPTSWQLVCRQNGDELDTEGCASKAIRRTFTLTDNGNGTITCRCFGQTWTRQGSFPAEFRLVIKDHNYTPDKDGPVAGHTWHWDNIRVA